MASFVRDLEFAVIYSPGPNYNVALPRQQQPVGDHRAYIGRLRQQGTLIQGGPFPDNEEGIDPTHGTPVLLVKDQAAALALVAADPAVVSGVLQAQVQPWSIKFGLILPLARSASARGARRTERRHGEPR